MEKLVEQIAGARTAVKVGGVVVLAALLTALNYFVASLPALGMPISEVEQKIGVTTRDQRKLDQELADKQSIANNLNEFRRDKELLDQRFREALAELPEDKRIDELLQAFQERASKAGLEILTIEPQAQATEGFYARIPIPMTVEGDYHAIATFLDSLGRLQRIVNVNNLTFDQPRDQNGRTVINARFLATTFMFVDANAKPAAPAGGAK